jgi:regulatory protein
MNSDRPCITRIEPLRPRGLRVLIHLETDESLEVTLEALELSRLGAGDPLHPDARRNLLEIDADVRVREAALSLLSYRARTRRELKTKLKQKSFGTARIDACLDRLEQKGLLDDQAVAAAFVRDRLRLRPRGKARLASELRAKGLDPDTAFETIDKVFAAVGASDAELARETAEAWLRKQGADITAALAGEHGPERDRARRRLHGYLSRRGFRGEAVTAAMDGATRIAGGD